MYRAPFSLTTAFPAGLSESAAAMSQVAARATGPLCENGRPFVTDPCSGQAVCLCQLGADGLPYPAIVGTPEGLRALGHTPGSVEPSAFRSPLTCGTGIRPERAHEHWKPIASTFSHPYDPAVALHPYSTFYAGLDLNSAARRKAATRETTSPLKAWLNEHRKNPYPTKAEKIMLAIITKMTLTQVSTWFANARRRLKKENKMSWETNDRDDDDDKESSNGEGEKDQSPEASRTDGNKGSMSDNVDDEDESDIALDLSDISDDEDDVHLSAAGHLAAQRSLIAGVPAGVIGSNSAGVTGQLNSVAERPVPAQRNSETNTPCAQSRNTNTNKPKIWSISQIIDLEPCKDQTNSQSGSETDASNSSECSRVTSSSKRPRVDGHCFSYSMSSPTYQSRSEKVLEKTPSPQRKNPVSQVSRPPLDTPPDTPPFDNYPHGSMYFKEQASFEYEALNLKTEKKNESPKSSTTRT